MSARTALFLHGASIAGLGIALLLMTRDPLGAVVVGLGLAICVGTTPRRPRQRLRELVLACL